MRRTEVFVGEYHPPAPPALGDLMLDFLQWLNSGEASKLHPIELAALAHWKLVYIHPFYDGNGRTARLLMNLLLIRGGFPPTIIRLEDRHVYFKFIEIANEGDVRPFIRYTITILQY